MTVRARALGLRLSEKEAKAFSTVARLLGMNRQQAAVAAVREWVTTHREEAIAGAQAAVAELDLDEETPCAR